MIFLVCLAASAVGGICGIGGGVIIKPVLDAMGVMSVSAISFLSGLTVLSMSVISVVRQRGQRQVELRTGSLLALGAVAGGIAGNWVFHLVKNAAGQDAFVGMVQSAVLALVTLLTLVYSAWLRRRVPSFRVHSAAACVAIGGGMGVLSAFLGIGGGAVFCLFHGHEEGGSQLPVHHHVLPGVQLCDLCDPGDDTGISVDVSAGYGARGGIGRPSGQPCQPASVRAADGPAVFRTAVCHYSDLHL